jgi:hypothetical protein
MKSTVLLTTLIVSLNIYAHPVHMDLEMTSDEYRKILQNNSHIQKSMVMDDPAITEAIHLGDRLSRWIKVINTRRSSQTAIRLTSEETRRGIPIDRPNTYSPQIIKKITDETLQQLPKAMKAVLLTTDELPSELPVSDETFIEFARKIDRNYQSAARYKSLTTISRRPTKMYGVTTF